MSDVKIEPFFFGSDEDTNIQVSPENLPGAVQTEDKKEPLAEDKNKESLAIEETEEIVNGEEKEVEEDDDIDPLNLFNKPPKTKKEEKKDEKLTSDKIDYKAFSDFLVETEVWKDFEGREDIEYNAETFQSLWKAQAENTAKEILLEERSQLGGTANELIEFLKTGGTVEQYTANYSQQVDIESIDISSEDGQEKIVKEYYESIGWKPEKIKKQIQRLQDESELKEEAEDCKAKLVEAISSEREQMLKEQAEIAEDRRIKAERFNKAVKESIYKDESLADREKKDLEKFVYEYKYQDDQGRKYSEFAVKMGEINQDPKKYAKFLKFVKNIEEFEDAKTAVKKEAKKTFNFLKTGSNLLEGAESKSPERRKVENTPPAFKFK